MEQSVYLALDRVEVLGHVELLKECCAKAMGSEGRRKGKPTTGGLDPKRAFSLFEMQPETTECTGTSVAIQICVCTNVP